MIIYLGALLPTPSSDTKAFASTVLHTDRHLAVSAGLNRIVSVRSPMLAHDGYYPLPVRVERASYKFLKKIKFIKETRALLYKLSTFNFINCVSHTLCVRTFLPLYIAIQRAIIRYNLLFLAYIDKLIKQYIINKN